MKTYHPNTAGIRLSQSEAMLQALQAGFFEIFFEKNSILALLANPACDFIRFIPLSVSKKEQSLAAVAIGRNGKVMQTGQNYLAGNGTIRSQRRTAASVRKSNFHVDFYCGDLIRLLSAADATGLRIFPGFVPGQQPALIAAAVDHRGFDIANGLGYILNTKASRKQVFNNAPA